MSTSLTQRQQVAEEGIPRLGAEAALDAIKDWGKPASDITHLVVATTSIGCLPGADCVLIKLLGLPPSTIQARDAVPGRCYGGTTALRVSKDIAESNPGARVLVVTSEVMSLVLRGPSESHIGNLVGQAVFGDAAGAVVVGCPTAGERPVFELVAASQDVLPDTEDAVVVKLRDEGVVITMHRDVPLHVSSHVSGVP
jgi:predicted naringenin-chalcone synthase